MANSTPVDDKFAWCAMQNTSAHDGWTLARHCLSDTSCLIAVEANHS
jgi:hypothetical protein